MKRERWALSSTMAGSRLFSRTALSSSCRFPAIWRIRNQPDDTDWVQHTYDAWPATLVGETFFLVAPWCKDPTPPGRIRLEINPGMQCGTGQHPCTQFCLEAMERTDAARQIRCWM